MKKKFLSYLIIGIFIFSLSGCGSETTSLQVNVSNNENLSSNQLGEFISIDNHLVYDVATKIVYVENYTYRGYDTYTPYYAPNGLPYKYDPKTNTFIEIDKE